MESLVARTLDHIAAQKKLAQKNPINKIKAPVYHVFQYGGFKCMVIRCLCLNMTWLGIIFTNNKPMKWPENSRFRPFTVGIDFDFRWRGERIIGFHTDHLQDDNTLRGNRVKKGADYTANQLKMFINKFKKSATKIR